MSQPDRGPGLPAGLKGKMPALGVIAMPADTNAHGNIFGGWLMSHMDMASAQTAIEATGQDLVTRAAQIEFVQPVRVGDRVLFFSDIERTGRTSITIRLAAWAQRRADGRYDEVGTGLFTFVAIDKNKNKTAVVLKP